MCGINGVVDFTGTSVDGEAAVKKMNDALAHRGPDGEGIFRSASGTVTLGSRRLSIVDVATGSMPIIVHHAGNEYAIVSNGEFFNHKELRSELERTYTFKTHSDTEAALFAYIEWGEQCVERLRGQFAFLVYDGKNERVFFARDRVGIKPLYYCLLSERLIVSSEPKGILTHPDVRRKPDRRAIADYFLGVLVLGKSEPLDRSFFEGIYALGPGMTATFGKSGLHLSTYYDLPLIRTDRPRDAYVEGMRREVERAVLGQVPDEVPYGVALSGGLDSSIITLLCVKNARRPVAVTALRFAEPRDNADHEYATLLTARAGMTLHSPVLSSERMMSDLDKLIFALDRPCDAPKELALVGMYANLRDMGSKVALIGEGSDEFNLGYYYTLPGFYEARDACSTAEGLRSLLTARVPEVARYFNPRFIDERLLDGIIRDNVRDFYERCPSSNSLDRMQYFYAKKFLKFRLDINDRCAMASSVEARVPYCDEALIALSLQVPPQLNLRDDSEKTVLRDAFKDVLPERIRLRRKAPTPESTDPKFYRMILDAFDSEYASADDPVWELLDKAYTEQIRAVADQKIADLEHGLVDPRGLYGGVAIEKPIEFRIKHLFVILTFLRWYRFYFDENIFA